ncbi:MULTISPECIES: phosphatase PAP2 family protein [Streptomyces]|jgi:undecaprenyl-diphosphatase|uniref:phosphatase PAP2 family protein n=1 Tax=Streptomyces TaxID=1883 RepID=UPI000F743BBB|nr:phosphatase PAP2 family protein [Streptomyces sp. WAC05292]RSS89751.1 phosphatase PAP2 family protein [Streptomyces sp. WAC05292]
MDTSDLYRDITDSARSAPGWVQTAFEVWTELGLLIFGFLFIAVWWRGRGQRSPRAVALAVLAPLATAFAYVVSETAKVFVQEERPCRAVANAAASLSACPEPGDWSFPSNHSAIAGAAAVALALALRRLVLLTLPIAALMAYSRVFVGVHYPHDVAVGLVGGGIVAALFVLALTGPVSRIAASMRASGNQAAMWFTGPGSARRT